MSTINAPARGTEVKLNVSIKPSVAQYTMDEFEFLIEFYGDKGGLTLTKSECIRIDEENYVAIVNTEVTGSGSLDAKVIAYIPDADCDDGFRTEVVIVKGIQRVF